MKPHDPRMRGMGVGSDGPLAPAAATSIVTLSAPQETVGNPRKQYPFHTPWVGASVQERRHRRGHRVGPVQFGEVPGALAPLPGQDRKGAVSGKSESVRVDLGGRRRINKKKSQQQ